MAHSVSLSWAASTDPVSGYNIYRGTAAGAEGTTPINASPVSGTTYIDTAPVLGEDFYVVKSVLNGVDSVASNEVSTVILPAPPTALVITASN